MPKLSQADGRKSIFLSTRGKNKEDVPEGIVNFLEFVKADLLESEQNFEDEFVKKLQKSVQNVKASREMEECYMHFELLFKEEVEEACAEICEEVRAEAMEEGRAIGMEAGMEVGMKVGMAVGKAGTVIELLEEIGIIPEELHEKIMAETNLETLKEWNKIAAKSDSVEEFLQKTHII